MEFNDGSEYRVVTDPAQHMRERVIFEFRAASAHKENGRFQVYMDRAFVHHREVLRSMRGLLIYQFPYGNWTPEYQADFFCEVLGGALRPNEMVMLDTEAESGLKNPADFATRWFNRVESRLRTLSWIYVPRALADALSPAVTGPRIRKAPRYSGGPHRGPAPWWPHDVHQYTDRGYFPGCSQSGDVNYTVLTIDQILDRCKGGDHGERSRKVLLLND